MKALPILALVVIFFTSCHSSSNTAATFCDTACNSDSIKFNSSGKFGASLAIGIKNCRPDTLTWTHEKLLNSRQIQLGDFLEQPVRLNKKAVSCAFQDTSFAWLAFNDCITGRGYLLKLPYNKTSGLQKITGALNKFDPRFAVDNDLRAYTDRGSIYVVNVTNGSEAQMTFGEEYPIDFNDIHKVLDSINVSKSRIYVKLLKDGNEVPLEKKISL